MRLKSRIERLETQRRDVQERSFRIVVTRPFTLKSTCTRTRLPNGLLNEIIYLEARDEHLADEDFERWVESFPIEELRR